MKQIVTSAGFLALGAASLYALDPELTRQQTGRPWSVAATVRGFYDDNVATSSKKQDSVGLEFSPSAHVNLPMEQTFLSAGYTYSLRWYEDRDHATDQFHQFDALLKHQFGPRHDISVRDSFVVSSEPSIVDQGGIITTPLRTDSDVLRNNVNLDYNVGLTRQVSLGFGYVNSWYDYEQEGAASRSALLDRLEHVIRLDGRYTINPNLVGLVGYNLLLNNFTGDELIAGDGSSTEKSSIRDSVGHRIYLGVDYDITARLRSSVRLGGEFRNYVHTDESTGNPYADASLSYAYRQGGSVMVGVRHTRNATDISAVDTTTGRPTSDAETTALYGQLTHKITPDLTASLNVQYQISSFNDGLYDGNGEDFLLLGANLEYRINRHFTTEIGYSFDDLSSDLAARSFDRNRVYIGLRASY